MKKASFRLSFVFVFLSLLGISQTNTKINNCKEVENTYQIVAANRRVKLAITSDVCDIVIRERKKDQTFIYPVNEFYSIKIYSEKDIQSIKLPLQYIIYKEN
ncbi:MAG: hypothetical protein IPG89_04790 [Bacteroidetes bacterium]|nr:hypothetical protein [Bacteroidota bacterium]